MVYSVGKPSFFGIPKACSRSGVKLEFTVSSIICWKSSGLLSKFFSTSLSISIVHSPLTNFPNCSLLIGEPKTAASSSFRNVLKITFAVMPSDSPWWMWNMRSYWWGNFSFISGIGHGTPGAAGRRRARQRGAYVEFSKGWSKSLLIAVNTSESFRTCTEKLNLSAVLYPKTELY